jgi:hypothetical protein
MSVDSCIVQSSPRNRLRPATLLCNIRCGEGYGDYPIGISIPHLILWDHWPSDMGGGAAPRGIFEDWTRPPSHPWETNSGTRSGYRIPVHPLCEVLRSPARHDDRWRAFGGGGADDELRVEFATRLPPQGYGCSKLGDEPPQIRSLRFAYWRRHCKPPTFLTLSPLC